MKKRICVLLLLGLGVVSVSACGDKVLSDSISNAQDSFQAEETSKSRDTEETKENTGDGRKNKLDSGNLMKLYPQM